MFKTTDENYWRDYRRKLTEQINEQAEIKKEPKNIYEMAKSIGVKPTARYFNIQPSLVRYYIKKFEKDNTNDE